MPTKPFNLWPVSVIAFFVVAVLGCVGFVAFCNLHPTDLVAQDYYEQEIRYPGQIERLKHAADVGDAASIAYNSHKAVLEIALPPTHLDSLTNGTIHLYRPSAARLDRELKLQLGPEGTQQIDARQLQPGLWRVRILWAAGGKEYFIDRKVSI